MHWLLDFQLLVLLAVANGTPVVAKKLLGPAFSGPVDGNLSLGDGRPLFGASKTIRGIVLSLLATTAVAPMLGLPSLAGATVSAGAMIGDLLSSFVKRRVGLASSSKAVGLDQIPESLIPAALLSLIVPMSVADGAVVVATFFIAEIALSKYLFRLQIRDQPY